LGHPERLLEAIAGRIEDEAPPAAICREAMEEASLHLEELRYVATCWLSPGVSTERLHLYLAAYSSADLVNGGAFHPDEFEDISVQEISLSKLAQLADDGQLEDAKTLLLVQTLRLQHPELFHA
jgi:8-oxo-dGTP pyrophosphatase MutT (NUDIX family)